MRYELKKNLAGAYSVKFKCPKCGIKLSESLKNAGQQDACPECGQKFVIPGAEELSRQRKELDRIAAEKAARKDAEEIEKQRARAERRKQREEAQREREKAQEQNAYSSNIKPANPQFVPAGYHEDGDGSRLKIGPQTQWRDFWYFLAGLNYLPAAGIVGLASTGGEMGFVAGLIAALPLIASGTVLLFIGWLTEAVNHIRWFQSEQLRELKRHRRVAENKS